MKKVLIAAFLVSTSLISIQAQKLKDKINQLNNGGPEVQSTTTGSENQYGMVEIFTKTEKVWEVNLKNNVVTDLFLVETKNRMSSFERNTDGKVTQLYCKNYLKPDHPVFPMSYTDNKYEQVIFVKNYAFIINIDNGTNNIQTIKSAADVDKLILGEYSFHYILALNKSDLKDITIEKIKEILKQYFIDAGAGLEEIKKAEAAAAEEKRKLNSIKDKKITSITIECANEYIKYKENVLYTIVAKLADGTTLKTESTSPYIDDYTIQITGMEGNENTTSLYNNFFYTPTDKITLKVTSKYNASITATKVFKMKYEIAEDYKGEAGKFSFSSQAGQSPYHGLSTRVEIKQVKDANTGATLIAVKIFDLTATKPHFAFKCSPSELIDLNIGGKRNMSAESSGIGKPGYNGGDLKIIIDPNVTEAYNFTYSTKGGAGAEGKAGDGAPGKDGKVETVKQKVTW